VREEDNEFTVDLVVGVVVELLEDEMCCEELGVEVV
jgi:hypothetical protein